MTISSTTTKNSYSGNGSTTAFAYGFYIPSSTDIQVIVRSATGTETVKSEGTGSTNYSISGVGNASGGTVTFVTAPASGETVVLRRNTAKTQATDYVANDPFPAETHEDALDKLTIIGQDLQEQIDRSFKISRTNTMTSTEFTDSASDRANKVLAFDGAGELSVTQELGTFRGNWAASTAYVLRDLVVQNSASDSSTYKSIYICTTAHTSSGSYLTQSDSSKWSKIVDLAAYDTLTELTDTNITSPADASLLLYDTGTSKWIDNVMSGDATLADTGALTIANDAIETGMLNDNIISGQTALTSGLASTDELLFSDAGSLKRMDVAVLTAYNAALSETLTNKTLTSPVLNTGVSGTAVLDEDNMSSDSATKLATQQSIKAYVDSVKADMSFVLEDGDGTEVTITKDKEVKFIDGGGIDINWTDTDNGTDGDPYDLTFSIDAAQTGITSLLATDIKIGEDDQTKIDFETADKIHFYAGNENQLVLSDGALTPASNAIVDLGTDALEFKDAYFDGTLEADAITVGGTNLTAIYSPIAGSSSITTVGTIGTGTWQGTAIASTYIAGDAITAAKIADDAISEEHLDNTVITGLSAKTSIAGNDLVIISDSADSDNLKKMTRTNFVSGLSTGSAGALNDADSDTKVQVEESSDEDIIRFDTGGTERATMDIHGLELQAAGGIFSHAAAITNNFTLAATHNAVLCGPVTFSGTATMAGSVVVL